MASHKVGFVHNGMEGSFKPHFAAFKTRLSNFEFKAATSVEILPRWAAGQDRKALVEQFRELLAKGVTVLVAGGGPLSALAAKEATESESNPKPVVFASVADPVRLKLVKSLANPGTNMTGIAGLTSELDVARLRLLNEVLGGGDTPIGVLNNAERPLLDEQYQKLEVAASLMKRTLVREDVARLDRIEAAFNALKGKGVAGLLVTADSFFNNHREKVVALAAGMPAIYQWREFVEVGGFMSFGPKIIEAYEQVADYAREILEGKEPSDLPVALPRRFELVINVDVAYGGIPASLLTQAEFVRTTT
jgi:putative ABC transport system substrate-binding protein